MNKYLYIILIAFSSFTSIGAHKYGYINSQELLAIMPEIKAANVEIETMKSQFQTQGQKMVQELEAKALDLEKRKNEIAPIEFENQAKILREEEQKIGDFEKSSQSAIYKKSEDLLAPIQKKVDDAIKALAAEEGYTYIFDASLGLVLYADPAANLFEKLKAKLAK